MLADERREPSRRSSEADGSGPGCGRAKREGMRWGMGYMPGGGTMCGACEGGGAPYCMCTMCDGGWCRGSGWDMVWGWRCGGM